MSTVAPSKVPEPISRRSVAERRSASICQAALRTSEGSICSRVWARASSIRCCRPFGGSWLGIEAFMPKGLARCRVSGSRHVSSALGRSGCSRGSDSLSLVERSWVRAWSQRASWTCRVSFGSAKESTTLLRAMGGRSSSAKGMRAFSLEKDAGGGQEARFALGMLITKEVRTVTRMVAQKTTRVEL